MAAARVVEEHLADVLRGQDAFDIPAAWRDMHVRIRNIGQRGVAAMAISAVDAALWDLKAKLLGLSLLQLLGAARPGIAVYGSGGFTSYSAEQLSRQLGGWVEQGIGMVKMKIGRHPSDDLDRVGTARAAIGPDAELFVDANGAYDRKLALAMAEAFTEFGVSWFEEPVSSDDLEGLRLMRDRGPAGMQIAAGEYNYNLFDVRRMLDAGAVDVLQADATRCGGVTGFLGAATLCQARPLSLSAHTAPSLHATICCAAQPVRHVEYFHDHARLESMLFDGAAVPIDGVLHPDPSRPGLGLELKRADAERHLVWRN
jgi:L-alanine-DL-glutamate epimerase-like enolase superfamily enzyme